MAYTKQNFENGQVLTAEHLNNMEQGIVDAVSVTAQTLTEAQKAQARGNIGALAKSGISLGVHSDGLIYVFVDGSPVGYGVEMSTSAPISAYLDSENNLVLKENTPGALPDGQYYAKFEMENGSKVAIGELVKDTNVYYSVTNTLTNCVSNNSETEVIEGESYSATITANDGYELSSVVVTMGGVDITADAVSGGVIAIAEITGNIVITAVAEEAEVTPTYTNLFVASEAQLNKRINSSKAVVDMNGYVISHFMDVSDKIPFTSTTKIYVKGATITEDGNSKLMTFKDEDGVLTKSYTMQNGSALTINDEGNGVISILNTASWFVDGIKRMVLVLKVSDTAITTADIQDIVITIDEPIA